MTGDNSFPPRSRPSPIENQRSSFKRAPRDIKGWGPRQASSPLKSRSSAAKNIGSLTPLTIQLNIKTGKSRNRDVTQHMGLFNLPTPIMLWIGQRRQYKSAIRFVKPNDF